MYSTVEDIVSPLGWSVARASADRRRYHHVERPARISTRPRPLPDGGFGSGGGGGPRTCVSNLGRIATHRPDSRRGDASARVHSGQAHLSPRFRCCALARGPLPRRAQVATVADLCPRERASGSSVRGRSRTGPLGPASLRTALSLPAVVAMRANPVLRVFAERLRAAGTSRPADRERLAARPVPLIARAGRGAARAGCRADFRANRARPEHAAGTPTSAGGRTSCLLQPLEGEATSGGRGVSCPALLCGSPPIWRLSLFPPPLQGTDGGFRLRAGHDTELPERSRRTRVAVDDAVHRKRVELPDAILHQGGADGFRCS